jgi:hypothetical protein
MILLDQEFPHPLQTVKKDLSSHQVIEQPYVYSKDEHYPCKSASRLFMYTSIDGQIFHLKDVQSINQDKQKKFTGSLISNSSFK